MPLTLPPASAPAPVTGFAECNTSPPSDVGPDTGTLIPFDILMNVDGDDLTPDLPAGLGLTYSAGTFTATEDGTWFIGFGATLITAPGDTGLVIFLHSRRDASDSFDIAAAGNPNQRMMEQTITMRTGDTFAVAQTSAGSSVVQIDGHAILTIIRLATSVS